MQRIGQFVRRRPLLFSVLRQAYIPMAVRYSRVRDFTRRNHLGERWAKGDFDRDGNAPARYWTSLDHPHRDLLVQRIAGFAPLQDILEIGCNSGPNLRRLATQFPHARIVGIDVNAAAVQAGRDWLAQEGIDNATIMPGTAEGLDCFADKSFDVVFTDAVLIYVDRGKITAAVQDMVRIARKGLVLVERCDLRQGTDDPQAAGRYVNGLWTRDYAALLSRFVPPENIRVTRITADVWPDDLGWQRNGALVEVTIR